VTESDRSEAWRLESFLGSRVLLGAGLISLMLGAAFFVNLSAAHGAFPNWLRVLGGLLAGGALLGLGGALLGRTRTLIAKGLAGLGGSVLFLSIWGAYGPLHVISGDYALAFAAMVAVSGTLALLAWRRASQNVALFGLVGSLVTPLLLVGDPQNRVALAAYLAIVFAAMLILAVRCRYRILEMTAFAGALLYAPTFAPAGLDWPQNASLLTASILFSEFAAALFFSARRDGRLDRAGLTMMIVQVAAFAGTLEAELDWNAHVLAFADLALGGVLLAAAATNVPARMRAAYVWLGLGILTRAVAAWSGAHGLTMMLAVEGAGLVFIGTRNGRTELRTCGYLASGAAVMLAGLSLVSDPLQTLAFFNERSATIAVVAASLLVIVRELVDAGPIVSTAERHGLVPAALLIAIVGPLVGFSRDVIDVTAGSDAFTASTQTGLSALWSVAATLLIAAGFRYRSRLTRYAGIALFAVATLKVFCVDLVGLDMTARIISFLVLGAVLVAVAGGYQIAMLRKPAA